MKRSWRIGAPVIILAVLSSLACGLQESLQDFFSAPIGDPSAPTPIAFQTVEPVLIEVQTFEDVDASDSDYSSPRNWRAWPVVPEISPHLHEVYIQGLLRGNNPHAFSVIGDCQSAPAVFGGIYAQPDRYNLGEGYEYLQETIDQFAGSFDHINITVQNGFGASTVFSPMWSDPDLCLEGETPIECEFRLHRPSIVFINLGTNWIENGGATHEAYLRQMVEFALSRGVIPILSTKADNFEGDQSINEGIARVASEYRVPLWNFWRAVQNLPNRGLDPSRDSNYLSVQAWNERNFTGLQALDAVWRSVKSDATARQP
jgi:hypothetical protein